jgi:translation initiation factor 2 subunit 3
METINVGIFGHIDHGKTTLLEKLSGKWASVHSEELKRGITIKLGYADTCIYKDGENYNLSKKGKPVRHVSFIDAPGHEMLMATTLSGAALIDVAILVVAANEGIKPQTREHLMALKAKGIKKLIVVQNKIDLVKKEEALESYKTIKEFLGSQYEDVEIIPASAQQGVNISEILRAIAGLKIPERNLNSEPIFIIARSFDVNRPGSKPEELNGAVLGGTLKCGKLKVGDEIEIKPGRKIKDESGTRFIPVKTKIKKLFVGSQSVTELTPGGSVGIETSLDMSLGKGDFLSGNLASLVGKLPDSKPNIKIKYELFPEVLGVSGHVKVDEIKKGETLMVSVNASVTGGTVSSVNKENLEIGLKVPAIVFTGDNAGIARNIKGHWRLIGYGKIS